MVTRTDSESWDWNAIRRWCRGVATRCAGPDLADDIAQEALLRAWRRRDSCRDPSHPWPWLAQITRNEAIRLAQRQGAPPCEVPDVAGAPEPPDAVLPRLAVRDALACLGDLDRRLLRLHYELDFGVSALAQMYGLSPGAVRVRMHRARSVLRAVIGEQ